MLKNNAPLYRIMSCTDYNGNSKVSHAHRVGRIVSGPEIDEVYGYVWLHYIYEKDGSCMSEGQYLKTSPVVQLVSSTVNEKEIIRIVTENTIYILEEASIPLEA